MCWNLDRFGAKEPGDGLSYLCGVLYGGRGRTSQTRAGPTLARDARRHALSVDHHHQRLLLISSLPQKRSAHDLSVSSASELSYSVSCDRASSGVIDGTEHNYIIEFAL